jgi:hypothetical protein
MSNQIQSPKPRKILNFEFFPKPSATKERVRFRGSRDLRTDVSMLNCEIPSRTVGILANLASLRSEICGRISNQF